MVGKLPTRSRNFIYARDCQTIFEKKELPIRFGTLNAVLDSVVLSLKKNKKVQFAGFGTFEVVKGRARKGRNPATGEVIKIKAKKRVRFRAGATLKGGI